ncbi:hypothetical protein [Polaromonas vacuolata]|uniref:hypothetical protein n=1 Tax=Polaromonas vacuolata TaxID=37448 RepID=UPI001EE2B976|nr:hypothetical protein [Polaromonas vacuolata]
MAKLIVIFASALAVFETGAFLTATGFWILLAARFAAAVAALGAIFFAVTIFNFLLFSSAKRFLNHKFLAVLYLCCLDYLGYSYLSVEN